MSAETLGIWSMAMDAIPEAQRTLIDMPEKLCGDITYGRLYYATARELFDHHKAILHALAMTVWVPWKGWDYSGTC